MNPTTEYHRNQFLKAIDMAIINAPLAMTRASAPYPVHPRQITFTTERWGSYTVNNYNERLVKFRKQVATCPGFHEYPTVQKTLPKKIRCAWKGNASLTEWKKSTNPEDMRNAIAMLELQGKDATAYRTRLMYLEDNPDQTPPWVKKPKK